MHTEHLLVENSRGSNTTLVVLGFAALGAFSFGLACVILLMRPDALSGDPVRGLVLALTHLVTLGWIASVMFAGAYLLAPILANSPLWSQRLPVFHLFCHGTGLAFMLGGLAELRYEMVSIGAGIVCLGLLALIVNLMVTASRRTVWSPANLGFQTSMFWLAVTGAVALFMLRQRVAPFVDIKSDTLIALHANGALFGFLTQALLSVSLWITPKLLKLEKTPNWLNWFGWTGWVFLNLGLLLFPMLRTEPPIAVVLIGILIAIGGAGFAAQIAGCYLLPRAKWSWGATTHLAGVLLMGLIVAGALWSFPQAESATVESLRSWIRLYISLSLLGPFAFAILGIGERLLPQLIWRLRFGPWARYTSVPEEAVLGQNGASAPMFFSLVMAWIYLYMGQVEDAANSTRIGAVLLLVAFVWFVVAVAPALNRLALGVTPDSLPNLRLGAADLSK